VGGEEERKIRENYIRGKAVVLLPCDGRRGIFVTSNHTLLSQCVTSANY